MENTQRISVVVTYLPISKKIDDMTLKCVDLIYKNTSNQYDITIVSNGVLKENFLSRLEHDCEILESTHNEGNANAWDRGVRNSKNNIIILMDNDVFVQKDWDKEMVDTLHNDAVGVVFPFSVLGTKDYRSKVYRGRKDGFCFGITKEVYNRAGPFLKDQPFHSYYEDDAFFAEVQFKMGLKLVACENSKVFHRGQGTTKKMWNKEIEDGIQLNKEWYENKYNKQYPYLT